MYSANGDVWSGPGQERKHIQESRGGRLIQSHLSRLTQNHTTVHISRRWQHSQPMEISGEEAAAGLKRKHIQGKGVAVTFRARKKRPTVLADAWRSKSKPRVTRCESHVTTHRSVTCDTCR